MLATLKRNISKLEQFILNKKYDQALELITEIQTLDVTSDVLKAANGVSSLRSILGHCPNTILQERIQKTIRMWERILKSPSTTQTTVSRRNPSSALPISSHISILSRASPSIKPVKSTKSTKLTSQRTICTQPEMLSFSEPSKEIKPHRTSLSHSSTKQRTSRTPSPTSSHERKTDLASARPEHADNPDEVEEKLYRMLVP